ncbi:hypothetical protein [Methylobacterium soli]|uniref:Uncharacterized protein n=1 Tax=Methylobacterium soli TaxID=553447 RepID=A0A6L3SUS7_9HYPH|nr:hypothetical protein [Methylobacterium soli]KAB1068499.1 hypothetical protein F6X53_31700 [Methylobacterium soli]GJE46526.1 hypothetical protein AEGHOMDF_5732 [Methylobacterium soli]
MLYTEEVLDRRTGTLNTISIGDWVTLTELGELHGVGSREVRSILRQIDIISIEGRGKNTRHRLQPWFVERGYGKRVTPTKRRSPFDVIGPEGRLWIKSHWVEAVAALEAERSVPKVVEARIALATFQAREGRTPLSVKQSIYWLCHHYPDLMHTEMASIINVSQQLVSREVKIRAACRKALEQRKEQPVPILERRVLMSVPYDAL